MADFNSWNTLISMMISTYTWAKPMTRNVKDLAYFNMTATEVNINYWENSQMLTKIGTICLLLFEKNSDN